MQSAVLNGQDPSGDWYGDLEVAGQTIPLVLHLQKGTDGWEGNMDSPSQGARGIPLEVRVSGDTVTVRSEQLRITYTATFRADEQELEGTYQQGPVNVPLIFGREAAERIPRDQEPTEFPYTRREVSFTSAAEGITLAGTLTLPPEGTIERAVILLTGSGAQNRDQEIMDHRPFLVLSDYLTRRGIAVLRYDDRGVGESGGSFVGSTIFDFAEDARGAVRFLRAQPELDGASIGLIGHSEGGITASMVGADEQRIVDFLVLLAAPGVPGDSLLLLQTDRILEKSGLTDSLRQAFVDLNREIYTEVTSRPERPQVELQAMLKQKILDWANALKPDVRTNLGNLDDFAQSRAEQASDPWFRAFLTIDPGTYLAKVSVPVFALNGTLDVQVLAEENLAAIEAATSNNERVRTQVLEGLNHLFQPAITGMPNEYGMLKTTFDEKAMQLIAEWVSML